MIVMAEQPKLSEFAGDKIIWVVLSTVWCTSCANEIRMLTDVYEDYNEYIEIIYVLGEGVSRVQLLLQISAKIIRRLKIILLELSEMTDSKTLHAFLGLSVAHL